MAERVKLYTIDHHQPPCNPDGGIVSNYIVSKGDTLLGTTTFADMVPQYYFWRGCGIDKDWERMLSSPIIGFQGYRKHLDFRLNRQLRGDWVSLDPIEFRQYQIWQQDFAVANIEDLLENCDILTNSPYDVTHNNNIAEDFCKSASATDWYELVNVLKRHGITEFDIPTVTSYCVFTGTREAFNKWMTFWWSVVPELLDLLPAECPDPGPRPDIYLPRRMAFLSERIYSLWLHNVGLRTKALPLLVCWELQ